MISLFRTNQFVVNIFLIVYLLLVRFPLFFKGAAWPKSEFNGGVAWEYVAKSSWSTAGISNILIASLMALIIAIGLNIVENKFRLSGELNLIPGVMFIYLASWLPIFDLLNPVLLALPFLVIVLYDLISLYKLAHPAKKLFNVGFWLSAACLFYPILIWYLIFVFVAMSVMRAFKLKEAIMVLVGWLTLFFLVGVYFYWQDQLYYFLSTQFGNSLAWFDWQLIDSPYLSWLPLIGLALLLLLGLFRFGRFQLKKNIQAKKAISVLYCFLAAAGLSFFLQPGAGQEHLMLLLPVLGYVLTFLMLRSKPALAEMTHIFMLFGLIVYQFIW